MTSKRNKAQQIFTTAGQEQVHAGSSVETSALRPAFLMVSLGQPVPPWRALMTHRDNAESLPLWLLNSYTRGLPRHPANSTKPAHSWSTHSFENHKSHIQVVDFHYFLHNRKIWQQRVLLPHTHPLGRRSACLFGRPVSPRSPGPTSSLPWTLSSPLPGAPHSSRLLADDQHSLCHASLFLPAPVRIYSASLLCFL